MSWLDECDWRPGEREAYEANRREWDEREATTSAWRRSFHDLVFRLAPAGDLGEVLHQLEMLWPKFYAAFVAACHRHTHGRPRHRQLYLMLKRFADAVHRLRRDDETSVSETVERLVRERSAP